MLTWGRVQKRKTNRALHRMFHSPNALEDYPNRTIDEPKPFA
jgi:hypothetical protein